MLVSVKFLMVLFLWSVGFNPAISGNDGLSRYRTDFHEIEVFLMLVFLIPTNTFLNFFPDLSKTLLFFQQIGSGNFSRVFKVFKRIDGCMYAVKHSTKQLHQDTDR